MRFHRVHIDSIAYELPERVVSSESIEARLQPIYDRCKLRVGRLELMSGIQTRRHFEPGTKPSAIATRAGARALKQSGIARERIGCLIHASVCRDFLEPATASVVHHQLELRDDCLAFDLSNACLGFANAMVVVAEMIEGGSIDAGLVVAGEDGGPLVEATIETLLADPKSGKGELRDAFASLTIGSGAAAMVLTRADLAPGGRPLLGGAARAATQHHVLCHGAETGNSTGPLMQTDSEALMHAGNELARETWNHFERELEWDRSNVERIITHQVGVAHRKLTLETLQLDLSLDFPTVESLGNMGSVSLPISLARAQESGFVQSEHSLALLGIGSGLHCLMLGLGPASSDA